MTEEEVTPTVRVVVVGHDHHQRGRVVADRQVPPSPQKAAGYRFPHTWGTDQLPDYPDDGLHTALFGPPSGVGAVRLAHLVVEPDSTNLNPARSGIASEEGVIDGVNTSSSHTAGMRYTPSVDMQTVIAGEVWPSLMTASRSG